MSANIESLADAFVAARQDPTRLVPASLLTELTAEDAMAVQAAVLRRLGETAPVAKVSVVNDRGQAAPIISRQVVSSGGTLSLGGAALLGLEIEVAAVLKDDLTPELAAGGRDAVIAAIDHYIVGIELIGTRIDDRTKAGSFGPMADNMITSGYVLGTQKLTALPEVNGLPVSALVDGETRDLGAAKHPFGDPIAPILAYASAPYDRFGGLRAGMVVTTGSLTPLIKVPETAEVTLKLGDFDAVSLHLTR